ncbi:MAG: aminotransferase class V-fold PLP-dependent enzyme, partial [Actinobacteria bacterium]|nr:aminotransferase class V-fold PLP-dependent enzyme [Actinomycetota bacterium]
MTSKPSPTPELDSSAAARMDAEDSLAPFAARFQVTDSSLIYLDGNSLGRAPLSTAERLQRLVSYEWGERLIRSWDEGWLEAGQRAGDSIGAAAIGAAPGQTLVADSTTVCLYKLAHAALDARPGRDEIVTDVHNFPTDRYVVEGIAEQRGATIRWIEADPIQGPQPHEVAAALGERTALVTLSHVGYYSAAIAEMAEINRLAHAAGALTLWDLSHSAGAVPVQLDEIAADLAVGCTYKYLNGGPGAPAYLYVAREHQETLRQPIWGWLGQRDPFAMGPRNEAADGIASFISGTPPILGIHSVEEG